MSDKSEYVLVVLRGDTVSMLRFNRKDAAENTAKWLGSREVGYDTLIVHDPPLIGQ